MKRKAHCVAIGIQDKIDARVPFKQRAQTARGEKNMAAAPITTRPPLPPFTRESAIQKVRLAEDGWNTRDPGKVALTYAIDSRWRNRSEFINGRDEIIAFLSRGPRSWTTASSRNYGRLPGTASEFASLTSGTTTRVTGIAPTAMRTGSSMTTGSWPRDLRPSMIYRSRNQSASIIGRRVAVPMSIRD
jgi:Protein of unknown function (DUF1348)